MMLAQFIMIRITLTVLLMNLMLVQRMHSHDFPQADSYSSNKINDKADAEDEDCPEEEIAVEDRENDVNTGINSKDVGGELLVNVKDAKAAGTRLPETDPFKWDWLIKRCMRDGMTWRVRQHIPSLYSSWAHCSGCNAYHGDTWCFLKRKILCVYKQKMDRPPYPVGPHGGVMDDEFYQGWSGGHFRVTKPVRGCFIFSPVHANAICAYNFGVGWEMAEHHDGYWINGMSTNSFYWGTWDWDAAQSGGWSAWGFSVLPVSDERYWTRIINQKANCWDD